jgi:hypothetical protein
MRPMRRVSVVGRSGPRAVVKSALKPAAATAAGGAGVGVAVGEASVSSGRPAARRVEERGSRHEPVAARDQPELALEVRHRDRWQQLTRGIGGARRPT